MTQAMNTRSFDTVAVRLTIECMEDQKEQLRVLLSALNDMDEVRELTPNVTTLLTLAQHIAEDHKHWSCLKEHLGLRVRTEGARCAAPHPYPAARRCSPRPCALYAPVRRGEEGARRTQRPRDRGAHQARPGRCDPRQCGACAGNGHAPGRSFLSPHRPAHLAGRSAAMSLADDLGDLVVAAAATASVAFSLYVTRDVTPPAVSAATSFVAECPTTTQYEISHVGPQRSMQITCEGIAK